MNDVPLVFSLVSLIYRKATKFCILIVYPNTLSKAFMVLKRWVTLNIVCSISKILSTLHSIFIRKIKSDYLSDT